MTKPWHIITAIMLVLLIIIGSDETYASDEEITLHYEKPHKAATPRTMYYDLSKIDLRITNIQVLPLDDTPRYSLDDADLVKVTITVTNNSSERFVVFDKMFELWIMAQSKADAREFDVIDSHDTTWDDQFEVTYEEMSSRELFNECDQTVESIERRESFSFTLCYEILKVRNGGGVNLDGPKKYVLVMMDNQQATSCPNCKEIILTKNPEPKARIAPAWISKLFDWKEKSLISEQELQNALDYLAKKGISIDNDKRVSDALTLKNQELAKYQSILAKAYDANLFVSGIQMLEYKPADRFSGIVCKKQNDIITLDADYTNNNAEYEVIFFRLKVFDGSGHMSADGLAKIVDVAPKSFRHLEISVPATQDPRYCTVEVDSKFP